MYVEHLVHRGGIIYFRVPNNCMEVLPSPNRLFPTTIIFMVDEEAGEVDGTAALRRDLCKSQTSLKKARSLMHHDACTLGMIDNCAATLGEPSDSVSKEAVSSF
jgi:hypothetical protein